MTDPNTVTVYDKEGTPFEVSRANAVDLVQVDGWTFSKPVVKIVEAPAAPAEPTPPVVDEDEGEDEEEDGDDEEEAGAVLTTEEEFEALPDRADVVAYLAKHFPDYRPHHLAKREKLIADAIQLATGE